MLHKKYFANKSAYYTGSTYAVEETGIRTVICAYQLPQCMPSNFCLLLVLLQEIFSLFFCRLSGKLPSALRTGVRVKNAKGMSIQPYNFKMLP